MSILILFCRFWTREEEDEDEMCMERTREEEEEDEMCMRHDRCNLFFQEIRYRIDIVS